MTFEDLQAKYDAWKAEHPGTNLVPPKRESVERIQELFGDMGVEAWARSLDQEIRVEKKVLAGVPFDEAIKQGVA